MARPDDARDHRRLLVALATREAERAVRRLAELQRLCGRALPSVRVVDGDLVNDVQLDAIADSLSLDAGQLERAVTDGGSRG